MKKNKIDVYAIKRPLPEINQNSFTVNVESNDQFVESDKIDSSHRL